MSNESDAPTGLPHEFRILTEMRPGALCVRQIPTPPLAEAWDYWTPGGTAGLLVGEMRVADLAGQATAAIGIELDLCFSAPSV